MHTSHVPRVRSHYGSLPALPLGLISAGRPATTMTDPAPLSFSDPLDAYAREADRLLDAFRASDDAAAWRVRWMHPRFRDRPVDEVRTAGLDVDDARLVVAREHCFDTWDELSTFTDRVAHGGVVARFERAAESVVDGDLPALDAALRDDPMLVRARSVRTHHATLLHYVAANGVEGTRQRTPRNVLDVTGALLDAGADPNALAERGARLDVRDRIHDGTPLDCAEHGNRFGIAEYLREISDARVANAG